jgi:phosphoglycerate dehydrogenase-like enzyme
MKGRWENMKNVLFTYDYGTSRMNQVRELGYNIIVRNEKDLKYDRSLCDVEILVCYNPFQTLDIKEMINLKWIQLSSIGIDQAPIDHIKETDILLSNNRGGYSVPMGEWIVLKVLESYKESKYFYDKQIKKEWKMNTSLLELENKTISFIGTGTIALEAAKRLQGFDMKVLGINTTGHKVDYFDQCFSFAELDYLLSISDIVVCTIPYTEKTHHMIKEESLAKMKDEAVLINVSRGSIIDEKALVDALDNGKFRSVALDVCEMEPLVKSSPLWDCDRVYISPHNSWISEMRNERRFENIFENLKRYINEEELRNVINLEKGY